MSMIMFLEAVIVCAVWLHLRVSRTGTSRFLRAQVVSLDFLIREMRVILESFIFAGETAGQDYGRSGKNNLLISQLFGEQREPGWQAYADQCALLSDP